MDSTDVAVGWAIIVALCAAFYVSVTRLTRFVVHEAKNAADYREELQEELDDLQRDELFALVAQEEEEQRQGL